MTWPMVKIKDIFDVARGGSPRPIDAFLTDAENGVNWIMIGDTKEGGKYIEKTAKKIKPEGVKNSREVKEGDFLLTNSMSFGRPYILKTSGCIHDGWLVLSPRTEKIHKDYFYYYLGSKEIKSTLASKAAGAVVKNLNKDIVKELEIPLPPLEEQKRIAEIMDKADAIRQKRQQAIALADQFLRSVFLDMFGDPVTNPKGWDKRPLHEIASHIVDCPHSTPRWTDEGIIALRTSNLTKGGWDWTDKRFVSELEYKERTKRSELVAKDLILSREGTVGIAALVPEGVKMCMGQRLVQIRVNDNYILPEYLLYLILIELEPDRISRLMTGSTSKHINVSDLKALSIMLPPLAIQNKFVETMTFLNGIKERLALFYVDSNMAFDAISQKAFSGQL
ncbi:restriction endonuclease subunit S [Aeromonas bivalvium]|uniref:restriction endonuclease subunit S n=1 Tax=Aeromonas bivalvium TaxID=440079 RepID=UPI002B2F04D3|nr:restriction endonuclease subunit S [Aeromonas hydrophila]